MIPLSGLASRMAGVSDEHLVVLSPGFRWVDLTNQAVSRLEVAAALRRAKRQPKPVVTPATGVPCVKCRTTGGKLDRHFNRPVRVSGARFGVQGLLCGRCYNWHSEPMRLIAQGVSA